MIWTEWSNGSANPSGFGFYVPVEARAAVFDLGCDSIILELQGEKRFKVRITDSFGQDCTEGRGKEIGDWFIKHGFTPWPSRKPPKFQVKEIERGVFRINPE